MVVDGKMPRVRCTQRNRNGHQCGNLIWLGQVACYVHRQKLGVSDHDSPIQEISQDEETY
jgi:hypothetical protein